MWISVENSRSHQIPILSMHQTNVRYLKYANQTFLTCLDFEVRLKTSLKHVDEMVILAATVCFRYSVEFFEFTLF
jgi:hypothetical protein